MKIKNFNPVSLILSLLICFVFLVNPRGLAQAIKNKPGIFYSIIGNGLKETSYLFGTYHFVKESYLDKASPVRTALQNAKAVVVELVTDEASIGKVASMGMMKNHTLSSLLPGTAKDSLEMELRSSIGVGIAEVEQFKPVNVVLTLSVVELMKHNSSKFSQYTGEPLDAYFAATAKKENKKVTELETIEEQMDLLMNHEPEDKQVEGLRNYLRNKTAMIQLGNELVDAWFAGDLNKLNDIYLKTIALSGEEDYLVKNRNNNWMKVLPALLQEQSQFIAVGALHLAGEAGLVNQLRSLGYTVTPINF